MLVAAARAGKFADLPRLLDEAYQRARFALGDEEAAKARATQHVLSVLRACTSMRRHREALYIFSRVAGHIDEGNGSIWSLLLYSGVESEFFEECRVFTAKLRMHMPLSAYDLVNTVRCHAHWRDRAGLRELLELQAAAGGPLDAITRNRALAACVNERALDVAEELTGDAVCSEALDTVAYNTLMKGYARAGEYSLCHALRGRMEKAGLPPSEVTFGIVLNACISEGDFDGARSVFRDLKASGVRLNAVHFTTLIKGFVGAGQLQEADELLEEMLHSPGAQPDLITYSTLVKAYAERGLLAPALALLERMVASGVRPDEVIFHSVLLGCVCQGGQPMTACLVLDVFERVVSLGLQPSTTTISILLKALVRIGSLEAATRLLEDSSGRFGLGTEARLYAQLIDACVQARCCDRAFEVFTALLRAVAKTGMPVDELVVRRVLKQCTSCQQFRLAVDVLDATLRSGGRVEPRLAASIRCSASTAAGGPGAPEPRSA